MKGITFKVYDRELAGEERSDYWDAKMQEIYFTDPGLFARIILNTGMNSFIKKFLPEQGLVLDGGCGSNYAAKLFDTEKRLIVGLDFAIKNLIKGKEIYDEACSVGGDLNHLPFKDDSFDAVLSISTAEHIELGPKTLFEEAGRVLKPGGLFLCLMPTYNIEDLLIDRVKRLYKATKEGLWETPHVKKSLLYKTVKKVEKEDREGFFAYWFSRRSIKKMLVEAGFTVKESFTLEVLGGMSRSRLFGNISRKYVEKKVVPMLKRSADEKSSWSERVFIKEEIYDKKLDRFIHELAGAFYRYIFAFVCSKNGGTG